ncbi:MAG TPA: LptF/LptG family permease [Chitinophagales bacterium]|nr:LptF/LptG family permease [Chitinophagales bacterium]
MLGIKKIDGVVFKAFIGPLLFTFVISEFIFLMQFLWKYIDDLVGKGLEFNLILQLLGLFSFKVIPMALPLAILLSSTMTMGNFGENNELVASKASGISTLRVMGSLLVFVMFLSVGAYYFSNQILPNTNLKFMSLLTDIRRHKPALDIREGVFYKGINGYTLKIDKKSPNNTSIYDIILYDHSSGFGNDNVIMADKGEMALSADQRYMIFELYNGRQYQDTRKRGKNFEKLYEQNIIEFKYYRKIFDLKEFKLNRGGNNLYKGYYELLNSKQLRYEIDSMKKDIAKIPDAMNEYNKNFVLYSKVYQNIKIDEEAVIVDSTVKDSVQIDSILYGNLVTEGLVVSSLNNISSMQSFVDMQKADNEQRLQYIQKFQVELNKKFMLSFACVILMLIGGSMGAIVRKGGLGMPILISACFFMLFHVLNMMGDKLAFNMVVPPAIGAWLPTIVLFPIAIWLTYEATTDSNTLKKETYVKLFDSIKKPFQYLFKIKKSQ